MLHHNLSLTAACTDAPLCRRGPFSAVSRVVASMAGEEGIADGRRIGRLSARKRIGALANA
jgi:hypothetical protein